MALDWQIGATANTVIGVSYFAIFLLIFGGLRKAALKSPHKSARLSVIATINPLGLATAFIFITCSIGHLNHGIHAFLPAMGVGDPAAVGAQMHFAAPQIWIVDFITMLAAIWYFLLRRRFPALVHGATIYEDMLRRRRQALDIHDSIAQGVAETKLAIRLDKKDQATAAADRTLREAQRIISELLDSTNTDVNLSPGSLRRARLEDAGADAPRPPKDGQP